MQSHSNHRRSHPRTFTLVAAAIGACVLHVGSTAHANNADAGAVTDALVVTGAAALAQPGGAARAEDVELRVYDTSDLPPDALRTLSVSFIGGALSNITPHLVALSTTPERHDALRDALAQIRGLTDEHATVEVSIRRVNDASGVRIGEPAPESLLRTPATRHVVRNAARRAPTPFRSVETVSYVKNYVPVVGSQSASLSPEVAAVSLGLDVVVTVASVRDGVTRVRIEGAFSEGSVRDGPSVFPVVSQGDPAGGSTLQLPLIATRTLDSEVSVRTDAPVVFAIVDDPAERGARLVATVRISPAE